MLPIEIFIKENESRRNRNMVEIKPLDRFDIYLRSILTLSKKEYAKIYSAKTKDIISIYRTGWNEKFTHTFIKL